MRINENVCLFRNFSSKLLACVPEGSIIKAHLKPLMQVVKV